MTIFALKKDGSDQGNQRRNPKYLAAVFTWVVQALHDLQNFHN